MLKYEEGSAHELLRQATSRLPFSEHVMSEKVLSYEFSSATGAELFQTMSNGKYINRIFKTELQEAE